MNVSVDLKQLVVTIDSDVAYVSLLIGWAIDDHFAARDTHSEYYREVFAHAEQLELRKVRRALREWEEARRGLP